MLTAGGVIDDPATAKSITLSYVIESGSCMGQTGNLTLNRWTAAPYSRTPISENGARDEDGNLAAKFSVSEVRHCSIGNMKKPDAFWDSSEKSSAVVLKFPIEQAATPNE
jgi:hypothetical protein